MLKIMYHKLVCVSRFRMIFHKEINDYINEREMEKSTFNDIILNIKMMILMKYGFRSVSQTIA